VLVETLIPTIVVIWQSRIAHLSVKSSHNPTG
jgi:hypothetical protein